MAASGIGTLGINPDAFGVWLPNAPGDTPWEGFLDAASEIGYEAVELGPAGYLPTDPGRLSDALAQRSLTLTCGYAAVAFHDPASRESMVDQLRRTAHLTAGAGAAYVLALARGEFGADGRIAPDGTRLREIADGVTELARVAADEYGLDLVFHPHVDMAIETADEVDRLLDATGGEVRLCLDVGQFAFAGGDPAAFVAAHPEAVRYLHLRDLDVAVRDRCRAEGVDFDTAARRDVFCEPGTGSVDFASVAGAAAAAGFDGPVIVERSYLGRTPAEVRACAERSFDTYRGSGFGRTVSEPGASDERTGGRRADD